MGTVWRTVWGTVDVDVGAGSNTGIGETVMEDTVVGDAVIGDAGIDTGARVTVGTTIGSVAVNGVTMLGGTLTLCGLSTLALLGLDLRFKL